MSVVVFLLLLVASPAFAQIFSFPDPTAQGTITVAALPTPSTGTRGRIRVVHDASTAGTCSTGGGTEVVACLDDGSIWTPLGSSASTPTLDEVISASTVGGELVTTLPAAGWTIITDTLTEAIRICETSACTNAGRMYTPNGGRFTTDVTPAGATTITMAASQSFVVESSNGTDRLVIDESAGTVTTPAASTTLAGVSEIATAAEINTGTDAGRAVSPDTLAGSSFGVKNVQVVVTDFTVNTATGDGQFYYRIPTELNGMNLVSVQANVITAGTTNTTNVDLARCATAASGNACSGTVSDMLSTNLTIDSGENSTATAAAAAVIDTSNDDVATGQLIRFDVDAVHTTPAKGLVVNLGFQLP